jgi:hypothetical protein
MLMPFGKYKGREVSHVPVDYLRWMWEKVDLYGQLKDAVEAAVAFRSSVRDERRLPLDMDRAKSIYRSIAFKWHPDRGGSTEAMQAVNEFYSALKEDPDDFM